MEREHSETTYTLYDEHLAWHNEPDKLSPAA
jgi:hypothetical protein